MICPICNSKEVITKSKLYDDRYAYPGEYNLLNCLNCDHKFLDQEFTDSEITAIYTQYYPRSTFKPEVPIPPDSAGKFLSWFNGERASAFRWVPKNVTVLDIGCGFGQSLAYHQSRGCRVYGVEADSNIQSVAMKYGFNVHIGTFNASMYESNYFDYVTMDQVIEHFINPKKALVDVSKILKPKGYAILSTPNAKGWGSRVFGKRWVNWHAPYHLHHFSSRSFRLAADNAGLDIVDIHTITSPEWLYYQWLHLLTYPVIGNSSEFWKSSNKLSKWQKLIFRLITRIHKLKVNHAITKIFDTLGLGDNRVYILKKRSQEKNTHLVK